MSPLRMNKDRDSEEMDKHVHVGCNMQVIRAETLFEESLLKTLAASRPIFYCFTPFQREKCPGLRYNL